MGTALEALFGNDAPKKGNKPFVPARETSQKAKATATPKADKPKKAKAAPTPAKETKKVAKTAKATASTKKSDGREKGLTSDKWHGDEATFAQTSFLRKATGLKTWDLDNPLTKGVASTLIQCLKDETATVEEVSDSLIEKFGCEPYVRASKKAKKQPVPEVVALQAQIAELTAKMLRGFRVRIDIPRGDKILRADPFSVQVNYGNVYIPEGIVWATEYINEMQFFPFSKYKDQIDASSGAFSIITKPRTKVGAW